MTDTPVIARAQPPRATVNTGAGLVAASLSVAGRMVRKFARTPQLLIVTTVQSALFLLMFRFAFGGAIDTHTNGGLSYVNFMVPGFIASSILWAGMTAAVGVAEDIEHGFVDRLRSLPIPRIAVLIGRSMADAVMMTWSLLTAAILGFVVGFRLENASFGEFLGAFGLCILFGLAFQWVFVVIGLVGGTAQAAQSLGMLVVPLVFLSSAYVPVASMPAGVRQFAEFQPLTPMVNAVRGLATGTSGVTGETTGHFIGVSLVWTVAIFGVFGFLAFLRFARH
jgi:ABC transporter DrrB family efflux protein